MGKKRKRVTQKNEKPSRRQTLRQKSHKNETWVVPFEMDKEGTQTNGQENKKVDDDPQSIRKIT